MRSFLKQAEDMSEAALITALAPMQSGVPGNSLRGSTETGQPKMKSTRTGVANEDKQFNAKKRHNAINARHGGGKSWDS
jgi:hypothetical protein